MSEPLKIGDIVQATELPERSWNGSDGGVVVLEPGPAFFLCRKVYDTEGNVVTFEPSNYGVVVSLDPLVFVDKYADDVYVFDDMPHSHAEVVGHVDDVAPYQAHYSAWQVQHEKWLAKNGRSACRSASEPTHVRFT